MCECARPADAATPGFSPDGNACRRDVHNESGEAHTWQVRGIAATGERGVPNHPTITIIIEAIVGRTRTAVTDGSGGDCTLRTTAHNAIAHNAVVRRGNASAIATSCSLSEVNNIDCADDYESCDARYPASHRALIQPSFDVGRRIRPSKAMTNTDRPMSAMKSSNIGRTGSVAYTVLGCDPCLQICALRVCAVVDIVLPTTFCER
jgi:hypothetical protein